MVQAREKGNRTRRACIEWLENQGYRVAVIERAGRFIKEKDAFGLFDLLAIKLNFVCLVQVATNRPHTHKHFEEFAHTYAGPNLYIMQYVWHDRCEAKVYRYTRSGKHLWWEPNAE